MPITEQQRARRKDYLGSSDASAILGRDPWRNAMDVFCEKTMNIANGETTEAMDTGNRLENAIIDYAVERIGKPVRKNQFRVHADNRVMAANCDAIVCDAPEIIEAKFTTMKDEWGEDSTDQVPQHVAIQTQHQMAVTGAERAWIPVLILAFRPEWRLLMVPRNQDIIDILTAEEVRFWNEHVLAGVPPSPEPPPMDMLRRLIREPDSIRMLDEEETQLARAAWLEREAASIAKNDAESAYERATANCLKHLVDCEACQLVDGTQFRYLTEGAGTKIQGDAMKRLQLEQPEIAAKYAEKLTRRVLRMKAAGKKKG